MESGSKPLKYLQQLNGKVTVASASMPSDASLTVFHVSCERACVCVCVPREGEITSTHRMGTNVLKIDTTWSYASGTVPYVAQVPISVPSQFFLFQSDFNFPWCCFPCSYWLPSSPTYGVRPPAMNHWWAILGRISSPRSMFNIFSLGVNAFYVDVWRRFYAACRCRLCLQFVLRCYRNVKPRRYKDTSYMNGEITTFITRVISEVIFD